MTAAYFPVTGTWPPIDGTTPQTGRVIFAAVGEVAANGLIGARTNTPVAVSGGSLAACELLYLPGIQYQVTEYLADTPTEVYVVTPDGNPMDLSSTPRAPVPVGQVGPAGPQGPPGPAGLIKRATLTFGSPNQGPNSALGANQVNVRGLNVVQATPTRYRFRISNANAQNGSNPNTPITVDSMWIGNPSYNDAAHNLKWLGDMVAAPVKAYTGPGALPTSGTADLVTPWVTNAGELDAYVPFVMSMGITSAGGGSGVCSADCYGGIQYGASSSGQAGVVSPASGYNYAGFFTDVRLEYEFLALPTDLVALVIGASGESGYTPTGDQSGSPRALNDPLDAWPSVWARRRGMHVINAGMYGSATTDWLSTTGRPYARLDLATTVPDVAVIGSMASNDVSLGASIATIITNYQTIVAGLKSLGIHRVFAVTIPPRGLSGAQETVRLAVNAYLRAIPDGIEDVADFDLALRDATARASILSDLVSSDGVHPLRAGYRRLAEVPRIGGVL